MVLEGIVLSDKGQSAQDMFQLYNILKSDKTIQLEKNINGFQGTGMKGKCWKGSMSMKRQQEAALLW